MYIMDYRITIYNNTKSGAQNNDVREDEGCAELKETRSFQNENMSNRSKKVSFSISGNLPMLEELGTSRHILDIVISCSKCVGIKD